MIVPHRPGLRRVVVMLALLWMLSLALTWWLTRWITAPRLHSTAATLDLALDQVQSLEAELETARQATAVAQRSDQVSRVAMRELQKNLASRDEEIAGLRADVAFYERLVGGSAQRRGLSVHSLEVVMGAAGDLGFKLTLTQNVKKGALTHGHVRLSIEGVAGDQIETLDWEKLRQASGDVGLPFEFRYFQQIDGSVMLPRGFLPHRVRVSVVQDGGQTQRVFDWKELQAATQTP